MELNYKHIIPAILFSSLSVYALAQSEKIWTKTTAIVHNNEAKVRRNVIPEKAEYYELDLNALKNELQGAPIRGQFTGQSNIVISFPTADGILEKFRIMESPIMHSGLEAKFPMIKTYAAQGIDDPTSTMRFSVTQFGLHSMVLSGKHSANYIDPYTTDLKTYIVYDKRSLGANTQSFECLTNEDVELPSVKNAVASPLNTNDQKLRKYRLAQSCNAEYGNIFAGTGTVAQQKANIQAQMVITMNRVNGVYERDLSITMEFIPNNDLIIYCGSTSADPWNTEFNTTTAQTIDAAIGIANYDIGHNFNTSGGGNAGCIGCVCQGSASTQTGTHKGRGMTGSANPTGDPFDIDYVAHEMGHQYGGYHIMNTCSRSGSGLSEVEPASGSSIMGYAGICPSNIQAHSDDDFNYVNVRDISANVQTGNSTCAQITALTNNPPTASAGNDYTIPKSTAYVLEGTGSDPDGNASLTYNWSQNDPAQSPGNAAPISTYAVGPLYRSISPTVSPNRWMPALATVLTNTLASTWEVTPSVARTMNFSFIVRDNDMTGGQTASDLMKVTVDGASGPFVITSQNAVTTWNVGATENITWNVANTTAAPVSAANVNIYLSTDGGYTYPFTLASNVPNSGSASVTVPAAATTQARIMVRGAGNIFYDVNNINFTIQSSQFVMNYNAASSSVCPPNDAVYTFTYTTFLGFNETTTFSASGLPAGATAVFNPASTANSTVVTMTVTGLTAAMTGTYNVSAIGTASTVTKTNTLFLNVLSLNPNATALSSPANGATGVSASSNLTWAPVSGPGITYEIQIATDPGFTNIIDNATSIPTNSYSSSALLSATTYYWRVRATNTCTASAFSSGFSFTTSNCNTLMSPNVPKTISATGTPVVTSTLSVGISGTITDVNVVGLTGLHSYIRDIKISLKSPAGTTVVLFNRICNGEDDFNLNFDDAAAAGAIPCPATTGGNYRPVNALSGFNGQTAAGVWTLTINDLANGDGGSLTAWGLNICTNPIVTGISNSSLHNAISIYPNPTNGTFNVFIGSFNDEVFTCKVTNNLGQLMETKSIAANQNHQIDLSGNAAGIYFVTIQGANGIKTEKIIFQK